MTNKKVAIYTTPSCIYCRQTKEFFKANQINYDEYDVLTDLARRKEMMDKSGQMGVPVITVADTDGGNESIVVGFDRQGLSQALGLS